MLHLRPCSILPDTGGGPSVIGVMRTGTVNSNASLLHRPFSIISQLRSHAHGDRYISSINQILPRRRPDPDGLIVKGRSSATEGSNSGPAYIAAGYADAEVYSGLRRNAPAWVPTSI